MKLAAERECGVRLLFEYVLGWSRESFFPFSQRLCERPPAFVFECIIGYKQSLVGGPFLVAQVWQSAGVFFFKLRECVPGLVWAQL